MGPVSLSAYYCALRRRHSNTARFAAFSLRMPRCRRSALAIPSLVALCRQTHVAGRPSALHGSDGPLSCVVWLTDNVARRRGGTTYCARRPTTLSSRIVHRLPRPTDVFTASNVVLLTRRRRITHNSEPLSEIKLLQPSYLPRLSEHVPSRLGLACAGLAEGACVCTACVDRVSRLSLLPTYFPATGTYTATSRPQSQDSQARLAIRLKVLQYVREVPCRPAAVSLLLYCLAASSDHASG
ncbi:hypothetical protein GY45DRAFT_108068 [Cubamyces sp. BRFM 1775]|nr:hypothetical protein GY45DRAFT_108068 [Cubamyces sp. BRFM 1775]